MNITESSSKTIYKEVLERLACVRRRKSFAKGLNDDLIVQKLQGNYLARSKSGSRKNLQDME